MLYLVEQYKLAHPEEGVNISPRLISAWAIKRGLWKRPPMEPEEILRRDLCRAMRNDYVIDPQGREVRHYHSVTTTIKTAEGDRRSSTWYVSETAPPGHMRISLQQRRQAALADVKQLKLDFESYNDNNRFGATLPELDFNFNKDLEELELPTSYPNEWEEEEPEDEES
jgi:hypothetical protein